MFTLNEWIPHRPDTWPLRYGELKMPMTFSKYQGYWRDNKPAMTERELPAGTTVKIVMVSRFGDVGITDDLNAEFGYEARTELENLDNLRALP